ncbi:hypothetical protein V7S57_16735 [Caulobacter sp. CCNWLY153]|uniref:hypothetical protein n=1 Tax=unclassified Caulobacter TaxID=2648921 RepID=UPI002FF07FC4
MLLAHHTEAISVLASLELDAEKLIEVVRYADSERALCTSADPRGFDLITMNARAARGLREAFGGERWHFDEKDNQAGIRNPHNKVRVIHCNFDRNCCDSTNSPTNLAEKGAASRMKVASNQAWIPGLPVPDHQEDSEYTTWVLGTHYDKDGDTLFAELSRPVTFTAGRYTRFEQRIVLLDGRGTSLAPNDRREREGPTEIVDIVIARK